MSVSAPYLKKGSNGRWYVHWTEDRIGKRVSTRTTDLAVAKEFLAQWILMEHQGPTAGAALPLSDIWKVYRARHVEAKVASTATADAAWKNLSTFFASTMAAEINQDRLDEYAAKRTSGRLGRQAKPSTVRREIIVLLAMLRFCSRLNPPLVDPSLIRPYSLPDAGEPKDRWLRHEEVQRLLDAARKMRRGDRLSRGERFLWLSLETAGRKQALLDLEWDRVDFETNVIDLNVPGRKRTKKSRAVVPISKALMPVLLRAHEERTGDLVLDNKGPIWATVQHIAINAGFSDQVVKSGAKPKATGISPHVLRHTAATHMARRGVPLWIIAKILGNSLHMVEKVYAKHCPDDLREAVDMISGNVLEAAE